MFATERPPSYTVLLNSNLAIEHGSRVEVKVPIQKEETKHSVGDNIINMRLSPHPLKKRQ